MSSPRDNSITPSSPGRPTVPSRAVTAPQLAAALNKQFKPDGTERKKPRIRFVEYDEERSSSTSLDSDKINDLRTESTNESKESSSSSSSSSTCFNNDENDHPRRPSLLPSPKRWQTYFLTSIAGDAHFRAQLLLMTLATGMMDAMTFTTYHVFATKQTGNTLFLALYAFKYPSPIPGHESNVALSISVFLLGAIFFGHIGSYSVQRRRIWLLSSQFFQTTLIFAAAGIRYYSDRKESSGSSLAILALLSFAASGQIATALTVGMPELNTTMITGALISLCTDPHILRRRNPKRDLRLLFCLSMLLGCFIGASILRYGNPTLVLVALGSVKGAVFGSFFLNRGMVKTRGNEEDGDGEGKEGGEGGEGTATPVPKILWGD